MRAEIRNLVASTAAAFAICLLLLSTVHCDTNGPGTITPIDTVGVEDTAAVGIWHYRPAEGVPNSLTNDPSRSSRSVSISASFSYALISGPIRNHHHLWMGS